MVNFYYFWLSHQKYMFSNSSKYAIRAILFLALNSNEEKKIMVKNLSGKINVPHAYTAKILQELSRHNLVSSTKGPKGGFWYYSDAQRVSRHQCNSWETADGACRVLQLNYFWMRDRSGCNHAFLWYPWSSCIPNIGKFCNIVGLRVW